MKFAALQYGNFRIVDSIVEKLWTKKGPAYRPALHVRI